MLRKSGEFLNVVDWRWRLLFALALLLLVAGLLKGHARLVQGRRSPTEPPHSWLEMGLLWESEGPRGQGVYAHGGQEFRVAVHGAGEAIAVCLLEPRLAVLIFQPLDLNRIDFDTLRVLKGVGPKMAANIITHRRNHGHFQSIEELLEVKGVGPAKLKLLRRNLAVGR